MAEAAGGERACAFNERRFGLRVWLRRRWCPSGARPPCVVDDRYEWLWLDAAVEPATGESFFMVLPGVGKAWMLLILEEVDREVIGSRVGLVLDGSGRHRAALA